MTLEFPLFHKLLRLRSNHSVMAVGKAAFLRIVDGPPLGCHIDAARHAHLFSRLLRICCRLGWFAIACVKSGAVQTGDRCRRCSPSATGLHGSARHLGCIHHQIGLSNCARQGKICLLVGLHVKLQCIQPCLGDNVVHSVSNRLRRYVIFAPEHGRHCAALSIYSHNVELITPRALDRRDIEAKQMPVLPCTLDVILGSSVSGAIR